MNELRFSTYGGQVGVAITRLSSSSTEPLVTNSRARLLDGAVLFVPIPSLERLETIADLCINEPITRNTLFAALGEGKLPSETALDTFLTQVRVQTGSSISTGCAADLIAVARAIQAQ